MADPAPWLAKARAAYDSHHYRAAAAGWRKALAADPSLAEAWYKLGVTQRCLKDERGALRCLERACRLAPRDEGAWHHRGEAAAALGRTREALRCFERSQRLRRGRRPADYPGYYWEYVADQLRHARKAAPAAAEAMERSARVQRGWQAEQAWAKAAAYRRAAGQAVAAARCDERALAAAEDRAGALLRRGRPADCLAELGRKGARVRGDPARLLLRARAQAKLGRNEEAASDCAAALRARPLPLLFAVKAGVLLRELGRPELARPALQRALRDLPDRPADWSDWHARGRVMAALGRWREALAAFRRSITANPYEPGTWTAGLDTQADQAEALLALGRRAQAGRELRGVLRSLRGEPPGSWAEGLRARCRRLLAAAGRKS